MNDIPETGKGDSNGSQPLSERKRSAIEELEMCRSFSRRLRDEMLPITRKLYDKFVSDNNHPGFPEKDIARLEEELREIEALEKGEGKGRWSFLMNIGHAQAERLAGMPRM